MITKQREGYDQSVVQTMILPAEFKSLKGTTKES